MPALDEDGAVDDEDTLSGLEGIPTVDTMVVPPTDEKAVTEPTRSRSAGCAAHRLVVVLALFAGAAWSTGPDL